MKQTFFLIAFFVFVFCRTIGAPLPDTQTADANDVMGETAGNWICIAYVETVDDFEPEAELPKELFLEGLQLNRDGSAVWIAADGCRFTTGWDDMQITSILEQPAAYLMKTVDGQVFLFVEWISDDVTILQQPPCYYVFKKNVAEEAPSDPVGRWTTMDFVQTIEQFDPKHRSSTVQPFLRGLAFLRNGTVWWIFEENRLQKQWSGDAVDYAPSHPAHFTIKRIDDKDYLFIEWISGDVTERGQKPRYYVLKKAGQ